MRESIRVILVYIDVLFHVARALEKFCSGRAMRFKTTWGRVVGFARGDGG